MSEFAVHVVRASDEAQLTCFTGVRYGGSKHGLGLKANGITGWSRRRMRHDSTPRPFQHGTRVGRRLRDGQKITLEAIAQEASQYDFDRLAETVLGFLAGGEACRIIVDKPGEESRWVDAVLDEVDVTPLHYKPRGDVLMSFVAPDAVRYGTERRVSIPVGGTVDLENRGTLAAWPQMYVTAAASTPNGYAVRLFTDTNPDLGYWRVQKSLSSPHLLDFKKAQVRVGGNPLWEATYGSSGPFQIPPGLTKMRLEYPGVGSASAVITYADSY
ncbi:hypothetical protein [Pseudoclavibacter sp. JSM 162008]|uniref:hypothetical protein n=1 Tax=Pseudoclavibacter sp. JSM 162008 TaxID=3229855 RepID=UPI00352656CF